jgi:hypothetical protein
MPEQDKQKPRGKRELAHALTSGRYTPGLDRSGPYVTGATGKVFRLDRKFRYALEDLKADLRAAWRESPDTKDYDAPGSDVLNDVIADLRRLAEACEQDPPTEAENAADLVDKHLQQDADGGKEPYFVAEDGCLTWWKPTPNGEVATPLGTFDAEITEEVTRDDGAEQILTWRIYVKAVDGREGDVTITPDQLGRPQQWATKAVGMSALVMPGLAIADHLRVAVQSRSRNPVRKIVYGHTGWRRLGGEWAYLTSSGAMHASGLDGSVTVDLGTLRGYELPDVRSVRDVRDPVRKSLSLLDVAPDKVTVPLLAAIYRAPLPLPPDAAVWLYGRSGTYKSALTAIAQQHYGPTMDAQGLPGNWTSTANALEAQAFMLDSALFTVDDYSPDATRMDAQRRASAADRLIRGSANRTGRDRQRPDGTLRPHKPPRAQVLTSAEDIPPGVESMRARSFVCEISRGDVKLGKLTELQQAARDATLAEAMTGYVRYLAKRYDTDSALPQTLTAERSRLRDHARAEGHPRCALNIASLALGWAQFLAFAMAAEAITAEEHDALWKRAWKALVDVGAEQERYSREAEPTRVYLQSLAALISSGRAYVAGDHGSPPNAERWGWVLDEQTGSPRANGDRLGWVDGDDLYLHPDTAYAAARQFAEKSGIPFGNSKTAVHKSLHEKGLLASTTGPGRITIRKRIGGGNPTVLHLRVKTLDENGGDS